MKVTLPFGIEVMRTDRVVKFQLGIVVRWAVQLADGTYLGQRWVTEDTKQYPTYKTEAQAKKALKAYHQRHQENLALS